MGVRAEGARERARRPACPPPHPPPQAGEGAVRRRLLTTSPAYGGRLGWGRAEGARKVARQPDCPHPSPSGQAQRAWRSTGPHGSAMQAGLSLPPQAGEGAFAAGFWLLLPPAGEGWDGGAPKALVGFPDKGQPAIGAAPGRPRNQEWLAE